MRWQAPSATGTLRWHAKQIIQTHGIAGFYKAVFPTTVRAGILTSSQLGVYDHAKHTYVYYIAPGDRGMRALAHSRARIACFSGRSLINVYPGTFSEGLPTHLAASGFAGLCCSATSNPIDVVKVRPLEKERTVGSTQTDRRNGIHRYG